jgi:hypothetical protein
MVCCSPILNEKGEVSLVVVTALDKFLIDRIGGR